MMFCTRHARLLEDAIELRGLEVILPGLVPVGDFNALAHAQQLIVTHATHFAGKAAVEMLTGRDTHNGTPWCPICFVNLNPAHVNCDGWVDNAADEALAEDIARRDAAGVADRRLSVV